MSDIQQLEDRLAITHIIQQAARAFDEKLHAKLLPVTLTDNATILYRLRGNPIDFSMPDGIELFKYFHDRCYWTQHLVSPHIIELGDNTAKASTPVHAVHVQIREDGSQNHWLIGATYHDQLVRQSNGWRIQRRDVPCPYVQGDFLEQGVQLFPELPTYE